MITLDRKLYLNAEKTAIVEEGEPGAAYVLGTIGTEITEQEAKRLGYEPRLSDHERHNAAMVHAATHHARLPDPLPPAHEVVADRARPGVAIRASDGNMPADAPSLLEQEAAKFEHAEEVEGRADEADARVDEARADAEKTNDPADLPEEKIEEKQDAQRAEESGDAAGGKAIAGPPATKAVKAPPAKK